MKQLLAILVFILFAARPVYNVGYYLYYELNLDYIVETYCINKDRPELNCNGKCYLMQQLQLQETSQNGEMSRSFFAEAFSPLYFEVQQEYFFFKSTETYQLNPWMPISNVFKGYLQIVSPPPQA